MIQMKFGLFAAAAVATASPKSVQDSRIVFIGVSKAKGRASPTAVVVSRSAYSGTDRISKTHDRRDIPTDDGCICKVGLNGMHPWYCHAIRGHDSSRNWTAKEAKNLG